MDSGTIIWIIVGLAIFIIRNVVKANQKKAQGPIDDSQEETDAQPTSTGRPRSLEDILRRIEDARQQQQGDMAPRPVANPWEANEPRETYREPKPKPVAAKSLEGYSLEEHPEAMAATRAKQKEAFVAYDHVKPYASKRSGLTEKGRFEHYAVKKKQRHSALKALDTPMEARKAFILGEIIARKHF